MQQDPRWRAARRSLALLFLAAAGCETPVTDPAPTAVATSTTSHASAAPRVSAEPPAPGPPPLEAEWETAAPAHVQGAKELGCRAAVVRDYVRVSCAKSDARPAPTDVRPVRSSHPVTYGGTTAKYQTAFLPGTSASATFVWNEEGRELRLEWPVGAPRPDPIGVMGPPVSVPNPCKALGMKGHGSFAVPCLFSGDAPLVARWTGEVQEGRPLFEVTNKGQQSVTQLQIFVYAYDAADKPVMVDAEGNHRSPVFSISHTLSPGVEPGAKARITVDPGEPFAEGAVKVFAGEILRYGWSDPEPSLHFEAEDLDQRVRQAGERRRKPDAQPSASATQ